MVSTKLAQNKHWTKKQICIGPIKGRLKKADTHITKEPKVNCFPLVTLELHACMHACSVSLMKTARATSIVYDETPGVFYLYRVLV